MKKLSFVSKHIGVWEMGCPLSSFIWFSCWCPVNGIVKGALGEIADNGVNALQFVEDTNFILELDETSAIKLN